jgi:FixJ family two-component response regulator
LKRDKLKIETQIIIWIKSIEKFKVYIVDDDELQCKYIQTIVEKWKFKAESFTTVSSFMSRISPEDYACIILDMKMPEMDGLSLYKQLKKNDILLPVIFLTGYADVSKCREAFLEGALDLLEKPILSIQLQQVVQNAKLIVEERMQQFSEKRRIQHNLKRLTERERQILDYLIMGSKNNDIAAKLNLALVTVKFHRKNLMKKLELNNTRDLILISEKYLSGEFI